MEWIITGALLIAWLIMFLRCKKKGGRDGVGKHNS